MPPRCAALLLIAAWALTAQAEQPAFEVPSIKPAARGVSGGGIEYLPGGRFRANNVPLHYFIEQLYALRPFQLVGNSRWMAIIADGRGVRYDIEARAEPSASRAELREMAKTLLADRFRFRYHREMRVLQVYAMLPMTAGAKLVTARDISGPPGMGSVAYMVDGWIEGRNVSMPSLARALTDFVDRPVIDMTGLPGGFDFRLTFSPQSGVPGQVPEDECPASFAAAAQMRGVKPVTVSCSSIFTAIREQLGLQLESRKAPVEVLVVDHIENSSAN